METNRLRKVDGVIQRDIADILQTMLRERGNKSTLISVTKVNVTKDLSMAKIYVSIFPVAETKKLMEEITSHQSLIKHQLAQRIKNQLRKIPELKFVIDDSLEYIDNIQNALKRTENPIENPASLDKRKKV